MSRSLLAFLLFCLALLLAAGGLVWHYGVNLAALVVDQERRSEPYHLLRIVTAPDGGAEVDGARTVRARLLELAAEDGGRLLWHGGEAELMEGSVRLETASLQLLGFDSGAGVVQFFTSAGYRALERGEAGATGRYLGSSTAPDPLDPALPTVVVLYRQKDLAPAAPLGAPGSGWLGLAFEHGGTVRWQAPVDVVSGSAPWNRAMLLQFPDRAAAVSWLEAPAAVSELALAGRYVDEVVVLLAGPV